MLADRLEKLAHFLEHDVRAEEFDMGTWGQRGFWEHACGTAACAMGWATVCFPGEGLRMVFPKASEWTGSVIYDGASGFEAAARFFEIPFDHALRLFGTRGSPGAVAERLLEYIGDPGGLYRRLLG